MISSHEKQKYYTKLMYGIADDVDADEGECCQENQHDRTKKSVFYVLCRLNVRPVVVEFQNTTFIYN